MFISKSNKLFLLVISSATAVGVIAGAGASAISRGTNPTPTPTTSSSQTTSMSTSTSYVPTSTSSTSTSSTSTSSTSTSSKKPSTSTSIPVDPTLATYKSFYPKAVTGTLHNPGMGWVALEEQTELGKIDIGKNGDIPEADNIGIQTSWDLIEKEEGKFDWTLIDETIDYWTKKGKRINLRICTDSLTLPEIYYGAPRWLYDMGVGEFHYGYQIEADKRIITTDTTNPIYRQYFVRFMDKLSEKYINNPAVDTIDIRGYGAYGEWHSGHPFDTKADRIAGLKYIVDQYSQRFAAVNKTLFLSCSWSYQDSVKSGEDVNSRDWWETKENAYEMYLENSAFDHAFKNYSNLGFRRDGLAGGGCTVYETDEKALFEIIRSGKHAVNCGEFYNGYDTYKAKGLGCDSPLEATEELLYKSRCNYSTVLGWLNSEVVRIVNAGDEEVFNRGATKMGYRLKVEESKFPDGIKPGSKCEVYTKISNSGLGRFAYEGYKLGLMLLDSNGVCKQKAFNNDFDLRQLLNGEICNVFTEFDVDSSLPYGVYTLGAFIADSNGNPAIRFAQVGDYDARIYPLGNVVVGNYIEPTGALYESIPVNQLSSYTLGNGKQYEITFDYLPSVKLENYKFGDNDGFELRLVRNGKTITVTNWQDVSETKATKTISFQVPNDGSYHVEIVGSGIYANKIALSNIKMNEIGGINTDFENGYNLYSGPWTYTGGYINMFTDDYQELNGSTVLELSTDETHAAVDMLRSNIELKNNTCYNISFDTKGSIRGGNGCYYYLRLLDKDGNFVSNVGEWYDRPDAPQTNKAFNFVTPSNIEGLHLVFGMKNDGGYYLDNINLKECEKGFLVDGPNHGYDNNVEPYDPAKGFGYVEGFENRVLRDCTFTVGFSRWGHLTTKKDEVISGDFSFSSYIDPVTFDYQDGNNFYEFSYSNNKYLKLEAGQSYHLEFDYKKMSEIKMVSDPTMDGWCYITARSDTTHATSPTSTFALAGDIIGNLYHYSGDITISPNGGTDTYIILGVYGHGNVIYDNIVLTKN